MGRTQGYCSRQPTGTEPARAARPPFGCLALHCAGARRTGQAKGKTAGFAAAGATSGLFAQPPSYHALERWQRAGPALTPEDECVIANAIAKGGPPEIKAYFVLLLHFALNPFAKIVLEAR